MYKRKEVLSSPQCNLNSKQLFSSCFRDEICSILMVISFDCASSSANCPTQSTAASLTRVSPVVSEVLWVRLYNFSKFSLCAQSEWKCHKKGMNECVSDRV